MRDISFVRQDYEEYTSLKLLYKGIAKQLLPEFTGDIRFLFSEGEQEKKISFDWVSSVMYCDELLYSNSSYPYFKDVNRTNGVFLVEGSSYLKRIANHFPDHHHYIYFDREFNWHITARGIEEY